MMSRSFRTPQEILGHEVPAGWNLRTHRVGIAAHGAVENWAQAVLETGAALLFIAWSVRQYFTDREIVLSPLLLPLIALSLLALGQLAFRGTVSSYDTRVDLQLLLTYAILLFLATPLFRTADDWRGFVWVIMFLGFSSLSSASFSTSPLMANYIGFAKCALGAFPSAPT